MRLERVVLRNICQHRHLDVSFTDATGVFGPNGSGKSNLLRAIKASLTGKLTGTKNDNICRFADSREESYIRTVWRTDDGQLVTIVHGLRPAERKIEIVFPDGKRIEESGTTEVNERIRILSGIDAGVIDTFHFVDQNDLDAFVKMTKSDQMRMLLELLQLDALEKTWEELGTVLADDSRLVGQGESYEAYDGLIAGAEEEIARLGSQLSALGIMTEDDERQLRSALESMQQWKSLKEQVDQHQQALVQYRKEIDRLTASRQECVIALQQAEGRVRSMYEHLIKLQQRVEAANAAVNHNRRIADLEAVIERHRSSVGPEPAKPGVAEGAFAEELQQEEAKLASLKYRYDTILGSRAEASRCPVCLQPADLKRLSKELQAQIKAATRKVNALCKAHKENLAAWEKYRQVYAVWQSEQSSLNRLLEQRRGLGERLPEDSQAQQEYDRYAAQYNQEYTHWKRLESSYQCAENGLKIYQESHDQVAAKLEELKRELQHFMPYDQNRVYQIEAALQANDEKKQQYQALSARICQRMEDCRQWKEKRRAAQERLQLAKKAAQWVDNVTQWREILHRDALGRKLVNEFLKNYTLLANEYLEAFDTPFWLEVTDSSEFIARMPDGSAEKLSRLSKGQSVMLSVCLQLAGQELFDANLKVLALDEPTDGLDSKNLGYLADMLTEIVYRIKEFGRQLIIVTHQERLAAILDSAIFLNDRTLVTAGDE